MNRSFWSLIAVCAISPSACGDDGLPAKTLADLKAASVFIKVEGKVDSGSGSGFVIKGADQKNYIVTNYHVVSLGRKVKDAAVTVVLRSSLKDETSMSAKVIAVDEGDDLAILRVEKSEQLPNGIEWTKSPAITETMTIYALGFPFGEAFSTSMKGPAITVTKGTVSSIRSDDKNEVVLVQINGDLNPGNSGGPVVDSQGRLIGIAKARVRNTQIAFAIPPRRLIDIMSGKPGSIRLEAVKSGDDKIKIRVEVQLVDPLNSLKKVTLIYAPAKNAKDVLESKKIDPAKCAKVDLEVRDGKCMGSFEIPIPDFGEGHIAVQQRWVNSSGGESLSDPLPYVVKVRPDAIAIKVVDPNMKSPGFVPPAPLPQRRAISSATLSKLLTDIVNAPLAKARLAADTLHQVFPIEERQEQTVEVLMSIIQKRNVDIHVKCRSIRALSYWGNEKTMDFLTPMVEDPHEWVRGEALGALSWLGGKPQAELIAKRISNDQDRPHVVTCLTRMGSIAEPATVPILRNSVAESRRQACVILAAIGTAECVPALQKLASDDSDKAVGKAATDAMRAIAARMENE
jgi:hypothetical protein